MKRFVYLCCKGKIGSIVIVLVMVVSSFCYGYQAEEELDCQRVTESDFCVTPQFNGGRIGNQLFEVATALSIARDNYCTAVFPMFTQSYRWDEMTTYGQSPQNLFIDYINDKGNPIFSKKRLGKNRDSGRLLCFEKENIFKENLDVYREEYNNLPLPMVFKTAPMFEMVLSVGLRKNGWGSFNYFSYKIFDHNKKYLQNLLGPTDKQARKLVQKFEKFGLDIVGKNNVTLHIRQGDRSKGYLKYAYAPVGLDFYNDALLRIKQILDSKGIKIDHFVVFSDDIEFAKALIDKLLIKNSQVKKEQFFFVDFKKHLQKDYEDIWLMSLNNHHIIGNSTFSWWGAYLNKSIDKIVIVPKEWWLRPFNKFGIKYSTNEMSPTDWIEI